MIHELWFISYDFDEKSATESRNCLRNPDSKLATTLMLVTIFLILLNEFRCWCRIFDVAARQLWLLIYPGKVIQKIFRNFGFRVMSQTVWAKRFLENWSNTFSKFNFRFLYFGWVFQKSVSRSDPEQNWIVITVIGDQNGQNRQQHLKNVTNIFRLQLVSSPTFCHQHPSPTSM